MTLVKSKSMPCVWAPAGGPPARYALAWSRDSREDGTPGRQEETAPAHEVELPPGTTTPWLARAPS
jgi:hypothetical protein